MVERAEAERRRLPVSRRVEQGVAEQPCDADARQRSRQLHQREGDGGGGADREDAASGGWRNPEGSGGSADWIAPETASGIAGRALEAWRSKKTDAERRADAFQQIDLAAKASLEQGITSFHDAGAPFTTVDIYKQAAANGLLGVRLWVMVRDSNENLAAKMAQYKAVGLNDNHLTIAAIKVTADGALGSRGALMLEPYSDSPASVGLATNSLESIAVTAKIARDTGVQLCVHAIGDRANREVLNIYERAFQGAPNSKELRWRIEHAQHISAADIPRFGQLGVIPAMQAIHATSDAPYVPARLGAKRAEEGAYVWQKLMKSGAIIANGTDVPVERIDPMAECLRDGHAQDEGRLGVLWRSEDVARRSAQVVYVERRVRGQGRAAEGIDHGGQARRHHGVVEGHHDDSRRSDSDDDGELHDRRR